MTPEEIIEQFEQKHLRNIKGDQKQVLEAYKKVIDKVFKKAGGIKLVKGKFDINQHPVLKRELELLLKEFHEEVSQTIINGITKEWDLSDQKNSELFKTLSKTILLTRNNVALDAFLKRVNGVGLNLSDKVWNYTNQFRAEIEQGLYVGISEGKSAARMAQDQKQYLKHPDKLFRRVRDAEGELQLSKAAKEFNPGQGVYRSSYKNAARLARTETNIAYRSADNDRYEKTKFILGIEVKLSDQHPKFDICDHLQGRYPKHFKFPGWHPQCMCFTVPILPSHDEYDKYEQALLKGQGDTFKFKNPVKTLPIGFQDYVRDNGEMLGRLKTTPYWIRDNGVRL